MSEHVCHSSKSYYGPHSPVLPIKLAARTKSPLVVHGACCVPVLSSFDMAENESYDEPADGERGDRRRRERVKKPPVPVLSEGTWVRIGDSCRSATLQGQVGTVVAWGRQVDVLLRGSGGSEGAVRKINPTDLIALSEEPEITAAEEQVTGEEAAPARTSSRATHAPTRGVRSTPLGKPAGAVTDEVRAPPLASHRPVQPATLGIAPCSPPHWKARKPPSSRPDRPQARTAPPAASSEGAAAGGGRGRRPARQKKEVAPLELGCWVRG